MKQCSIMKSDVFLDHRGSVLSFYPDESIVEYNLLQTKGGYSRGYHYHPHFVEYMIVVDGECKFQEFDYPDVHECVLKVGDSVRIPIGVAHTFVAIDDFKFVSMLSKRWNDSVPPIVKVDNNGQSI